MHTTGHERARRSARLVLLAGVVLAVPLVTASGSAVADNVDITVEYDGEEIGDGEKIQVNETEFEVDLVVESETQINSVYANLHNRTVAQGVGEDGYRFNTTHVLTTDVGPNVYTVTVNNLDGDTEIHRVDFYREPVTVPELYEAVERLEEEKNELKDEIDQLEEKREELESRNDELLVALNETEEESEGTLPAAAGEGEGLPGFTVVAALVGLLGALGLAVHRRR